MKTSLLSNKNLLEKKEKITWLAVLQGFSMLLVVLGHVTLSGVFRDPNHPFIANIERVIYSFHMPLFMFVSGWLFFLTCIAQGKGYSNVMLGKLRRLGIPLFVFTSVAALIKILFPSLANRPFGMDDFIDTFILLDSNPLGEMWFLITLLVIMAMYPLYCCLNRFQMLPIALFISIVCSSLLDIDIPYYQFSKVVQMLPYFIAGIICCRYRIIEKYFSSPFTLIVAGVLFLIWNVFEIQLQYIQWRTSLVIAGFTGISFSIAVCISVSHKIPDIFSSFRDYTFQIFLIGIFFQLIVRKIYSYFYDSEVLYALLFAVSVIVGVYVPVAIAKVVNRYMPFLKYPLGL